MNATRLIEEWRQQGRILEVEGANTVLWRMGRGETVVCVHGVPTSGFLYRKLLPELASRGLGGVTLVLPGWVFAALRRGPDRIKSLTVLNTLVDVSQFRRPWVMEPFAWPVVGRLWLQSARTPMFYVLNKTFGTRNINRAESAAYAQLLLGPDSGLAFLQIMRSFERTLTFEQGIKAALKERKFPAQIIWGKDDPALRMKKYAPHLLKALDLESYEVVYGKHFMQEDSSRAIASLIARLISALDGA